MKVAAGAAASLVARAQQPATPVTYTYKTAAGCDIKADVYGADTAVRKPVVIFIHGGALIMGSRKALTGPLHAGLLNAGYVVVSIDYRLAPEPKLAAIIEHARNPHPPVRKSDPQR